MDKQSLIQLIETGDMWTAESPAAFMLLYPFMVGYSQTSQHWGFGFKAVIVTTSHDYGRQLIDKADDLRVAKQLMYCYKQTGIGAKYELWQKYRQAALDSFHRLDSLDLSKLSGEEFAREYQDLVDVFSQQWAIPLILEGITFHTEQVTLPELRRQASQLNTRQVGEYFAALTQPEDISFAAKERQKFLGLCQAITAAGLGAKITSDFGIDDLARSYPKLHQQLINFQKEFYWVRNGYLYSRPIKVGDFWTLIKEEITTKSPEDIKREIEQLNNYTAITQERKQVVLKKLDLTDSLKLELEALGSFGHWQDERKEMNLRGNHYVGRFIDELAARTGLDYPLAALVLPNESAEVIKKGKSKWLPVLQKRHELSIAVVDNKGVWMFTGEDAQLINAALSKQAHAGVDLTMVEGMVASRGGKDSITGVARVVLNPHKDKFEKGEILITSMTRPEFVPLMRKAIAVVTNEGGITSHAAIVSRELNIPAIIGTGKATEVFKDGDIIELKLNHGRVQRINEHAIAGQTHDKGSNT